MVKNDSKVRRSAKVLVRPSAKTSNQSLIPGLCTEQQINQIFQVSNEYSKERVLPPPACGNPELAQCYQDMQAFLASSEIRTEPGSDGANAVINDLFRNASGYCGCLPPPAGLRTQVRRYERFLALLDEMALSAEKEAKKSRAQRDVTEGRSSKKSIVQHLTPEALAQLPRCWPPRSPDDDDDDDSTESTVSTDSSDSTDSSGGSTNSSSTGSNTSAASSGGPDEYNIKDCGKIVALCLVFMLCVVFLLELFAPGCLPNWKQKSSPDPKMQPIQAKSSASLPSPPQPQAPGTSKPEVKAAGAAVAKVQDSGKSVQPKNPMAKDADKSVSRQMPFQAPATQPAADTAKAKKTQLPKPEHAAPKVPENKSDAEMASDLKNLLERVAGIGKFNRVAFMKVGGVRDLISENENMQVLEAVLTRVSEQAESEESPFESPIMEEIEKIVAWKDIEGVEIKHGDPEWIDRYFLFRAEQTIRSALKSMTTADTQKTAEVLAMMNSALFKIFRKFSQAIRDPRLSTQERQKLSAAVNEKLDSMEKL